MSERSSSKGHQSVYDKALAIFQERIKKLKVVEQEIEKERVQTNIDYKFEERKIKEDLINMCRDRKRFAREAKSRKLPPLDKKKVYQGWTVKEKQRRLRSLRIEQSHESFPAITCTGPNIPKIMKRSISKESQFHNWLIGFPKIIKVTSTKRTSRNPKQMKAILGKGVANTNDTKAMKRHSKVTNIVFNVPLTLKDAKAAAETQFEVTSHRERKRAIEMTAKSQSRGARGSRFPKFKGVLDNN